MTPDDLENSQNALILADQYRAYGKTLAEEGDDQSEGRFYEPDTFLVFEEVFRHKPILGWLAWNDKLSRAGNQHNLHRLFGWLEPIYDADAVNEPLISKPGHVEILARIIDDPAALDAISSKGIEPED